MGSVHSFFRPARQANGDWSQQELAEFYRVEAALTQSGLRVTIDRGLSDEDDPWFVFCRYDGDVILHFARIDGDYFIVSDAFERPMRGSDFRALLNMVASDYPTLMPIPRANSGGKGASNIVLHPAALLAALVATVAFQLAGGDAMAGELATEGGAPATDSSSADALNGDLITGPQGTHHATADQTDGYGASGTSARATEDSTRNAQHAVILSAMALASVALPIEHSVRVPVLDLSESIPGASLHTTGSVQSNEVGLPGDTGHPHHPDGQRLRTGAADVNEAAQALAPSASAPAEPTQPGLNSASMGLARVGMDGLNLAAVETFSLGARGAQEVVAIYPTEIALTAIAALGSQNAPRAGSVAAASERTAPAAGGSDSATIGRGSTALVAAGAPSATSAAASPASSPASAAAGSEVGPVSSVVQATPTSTLSAIGTFASPGSNTQPSTPAGSAPAVGGTEIETAHAVRSSSSQLPAASTLMSLGGDSGVHAASIAQPTPVGSGSTPVTGGVADHAASTPIPVVAAITSTAGSIPALDHPTVSAAVSTIKTSLIGPAAVDHTATTTTAAVIVDHPDSSAISGTGTSTATGAAATDHPASSAATSGTDTPTATATAAVDHPATTATATGAAATDHPASSAATSGTDTPTATATAPVDHPTTTATAAGNADHPAASGGKGTPTATGTATVDHATTTTTTTAAAATDHPATSAASTASTASGGASAPTATAAVDHPTTTVAGNADHPAASGGKGTPTATGTAAVDHATTTPAAATTDHPVTSGTGSATQSSVATNSAVAVTNAPALDDQARQLIARFLETTTSVQTVVTDHSFVLIDTDASHQASSDFGSRTWSIGHDLEIRLIGLSGDLHLAPV